MKMSRVFLIFGMMLCMAASSVVMASPLRSKAQVEFVAPPMLVTSILHVEEQTQTIHQVVADATPINQYTADGFVATVKESLAKWAGHRARWFSPGNTSKVITTSKASSNKPASIRYLISRG